MINRLRAIAGEAGVRDAHRGDEVHGVVPHAVVAPESADACAAVLAECSAEGWTVEIAGGRTAAGSGRTASGFGRAVEHVDVLLSTSRMSGVAEYEPDDLTIGVAGGTTIEELRAGVAPHRQCVPLDPTDPRATVGGVLSRAAAGPMRRAWSTPRRQTLGIDLVTGDGRTIRVGGRVVKNVAGYDLDKLGVGSAGTLGVITRAHLRLLPAPAARATWVVSAVDPIELSGLATGLLARSVAPHALELVGAPGARDSRESQPIGTRDASDRSDAWRLIVHYEGGSDAVAVAADLIAETVGGAGALPARDDSALARLAALERRAAIVVRVASLADRLPELISIARRVAADRGTIAAHAGDGIARVLLDDDDASGVAADRFAADIETARGELAGTGTVVVERAPAAVLRAVDPWGALPDPVLRIMRELKRQFDPAEILQRGRWLT